MANVFYQKGKKYNCTKNGKPYFRKTAIIGGKQRSFYGDGEKDALRKIEEAKALEKQGFDFDKRTAKVDDVFRHWLFDIKRIDRNIKDTTFAIYDGRYRRFVQGRPLGKIVLSKLNASQLQHCLNDEFENNDVTGKGIQYFLTLFKQFSRWAADEGYLTKDPCKGIVIPGERTKTKKQIETFAEDERKKLLAYMEETDYQYDDLIRLAFATGMRKGELLALKWEDIEEDIIHVRRTKVEFGHVDAAGQRDRRQTIWDTKTQAGTRDIPIIPSIQKMLKDLHHKQKVFCLSLGIPQSEYVFINSVGKLIPASNLDDSYKRLLRNAGLPYKKFHAIRHTFATEAIRRGVPVKDLQMLMGHTDIATTYIYVHATEETKRQAIELIGEMM